MDYKSNGSGFLPLARHQGVSKSINILSPTSRNTNNFNSFQNNKTHQKSTKYASLRIPAQNIDNFRNKFNNTMQSNYGTASNDLSYPVLPILSNAKKAPVKKNHGERG